MRPVTSLHVLSGSLPGPRRSELVFAGDLLVFKDVPALVDLCTRVEVLIHGTTPEELQSRFRADSDAEGCLRLALEHVGVDPAGTCWDRPYLRVQPPSQGGPGTLGFHRDTWSSNVYQQVNWWTPIRPVSPGRTIAFYPAYWARPLANTSAGWDLEEIRAGRKAGRDVPLVPEPTEPVDTAGELRVVIEPGDLLAFSGAHLHASVPNSTAEPRLSVEVRTVSVDDVAQGRGARNLDGAAPRVPLDWFRRMTDGTSLAVAAQHQGSTAPTSSA
jgi:hypothetical protein